MAVWRIPKPYVGTEGGVAALNPKPLNLKPGTEGGVAAGRAAVDGQAVGVSQALTEWGFND